MKSEFPYVGDLLIFKGVPKFYFPKFVEMGERAAKELVIGKQYKIRAITINSSWCSVHLEGHGETESINEAYNLSFFNKEKSL